MGQRIQLNRKNQFLIIDSSGGIAQYYLNENGEQQDIIYGYASNKEKVGSMGDVLFPWPGRIENCQYDFAEEHYNLSGVRVKDGHANHGFAKFVPWEIVQSGRDSAQLRFKTSKEEYAEKGYPFALELTLSYALDDSGMTCMASVINTGDKSAPFGLGFHPYFSLGAESISNLALQINANKMVEFGPDLKPTGELLNISGELDYTKTKKIGKQVVDNCYADLNFENGIAKTTLSNDNGEQVVVWQDESFPYLQLYSADTIPDPHKRRGLAIEPQTCTGFAFNMPKMGLRVLRPSEKFTGSWGVTPIS
ncbi:MAG: hypothetical protein WCT32_02235 [Patescibacteria group bacterium]|jgi:aldose 1-epimerase